jgi:formate C-acetyltransferase
VVLEAAMLSNMPQPEITVLLKPDANEEFTFNTFKALAVLTDKVNIYNYDVIYRGLLQKGVEESVAKDFTFSACCTFDLNYHSIRMEHYAPVPQIFAEAMNETEYKSLNELTDAFYSKLKENLQGYADKAQKGIEINYGKKTFVLDDILLSDSAKECRHAFDGTAEYNVLNLFCPGIATIGDSLMVIDKLVFNEKRFSYGEFLNIVNNNFENHDDLLTEIKNLTMFGNNNENDRYTVLAANIFTDAAENLTLKDNFIAVSGIYSLERDNVWRELLSATPNGRKSGDPFSENQSPTYGADKNGITALLKSISKLPFEKAFSGGLNLTFAQKVPPEILKGLIVTYFNMGGLHAGISVIDRKTLEEAMVYPEKYKSLTVRLYGFSEYFVSLPKWQQLAVLNRTQY